MFGFGKKKKEKKEKSCEHCFAIVQARNYQVALKEARDKIRLQGDKLETQRSLIKNYEQSELALKARNLVKENKDWEMKVSIYETVAKEAVDMVRNSEQKVQELERTLKNYEKAHKMVVNELKQKKALVEFYSKKIARLNMVNEFICKKQEMGIGTELDCHG